MFYKLARLTAMKRLHVKHNDIILFLCQLEKDEIILLGDYSMKKTYHQLD